MSGTMSEQAYLAVARMVVRSAATLEVVWINRRNWMQIDETANPFHIGTTASWTQCTRLRELGISRNEESLMTAYRWELPLAFSIFGPIKDYSTVFGQLEKLRLAVKESLWECADGYFIGSGDDYWDVYDYYSNYKEFYGIDFDEKDDKDWKPLTAVAPTKEKIREYQRQQAERNHQRAFILQVRELFGRLKDLKQLRELEIEWNVCSSTLRCHWSMLWSYSVRPRSMTATTIADTNGHRRAGGGEVTHEDLVWLCLPWYPQPAPQPSRAPSKTIKAATHQYENKAPLSISCNDISDYSGTFPAWSTGDIYNARIGRHWKDWTDVALESHPCGDLCPRCHSFSCYGRYGYDFITLIATACVRTMWFSTVVILRDLSWEWQGKRSLDGEGR